MRTVTFILLESSKGYKPVNIYNMKLHLLLLPLLLSATSCSYCSSCVSSAIGGTEPQGKPDSTTVTLSHFNSLTASKGLHITYNITDKAPYAKIIAPSDFLPYIELTVKNNRLDCNIKSGCRFCNYSNSTQIHIYGPAVNNIVTASSASIDFSNLLVTSEPVCLTAASTSSITLSVRTPALEASTSSSAAITVAATAQTASFSASSSGCVQAAVNASKALDATASSSGLLQLEGTAPVVALAASSSGSIQAKNLKADTGAAAASSSGTISCSIADPSSIRSSSSGTVRNN